MLGFAPERPANLARALEKRGLLAAAVRLGPGQAGRRGNARHVSRTADVPDSRRAGPGDRVWRPRARPADAEIYQLARIAALLEVAQCLRLVRGARGDRQRRSRDRRRGLPRRDRGVAGGLQGDGREPRHRADGRPVAARRALHAQCVGLLRRRRRGAQGLVAGAGDFSCGRVARPRDFHPARLRSRHFGQASAERRRSPSLSRRRSCWSIISWPSRRPRRAGRWTGARARRDAWPRF